MTGRSAEGRTCEICRRRLLAGETFEFLDDPTRRKHRRPVCALCQRQARERGWTRTVEIPPAIELPIPPLPDSSDFDEASPRGTRYDGGGGSPSQ